MVSADLTRGVKVPCSTSLTLGHSVFFSVVHVWRKQRKVVGVGRSLHLD